MYKENENSFENYIKIQDNKYDIEYYLNSCI